MTTDNVNYSSLLTHYLLQTRLQDMGNFTMLDVGCSGGVHELFFQFGPLLKAVGFDPLLYEVEKLNRENKIDGIRYEAAYVGSKNPAIAFLQEQKDKIPTTDFLSRTSSMRAQKGNSQAYQKEHFNSGHELKFTDRRIALDEYVQQHNMSCIDFIKIDTDGYDYDVLLSAEKLLTDGVLGASIESPFQGPVHEHANIFCNIDRFMRSKGFSLFDLDSFRYARGALPTPFYYDIPAQTDSGALLWAEAVYFRDIANPNYMRDWNFKATPSDVLKLVCLYDMFGLPDCAAELIIAQPHIFNEEQKKIALDLLVPPMIVGKLSYDEYVGVFDMEHDLWYPKKKLFPTK